MQRWMEPLKRCRSEWQQNKEIIGERETRLPHQWPLYALSQLSEGEDVWTQSSPAQSSPSTSSINTIRIHLDIKSVENIAELRRILNVLAFIWLKMRHFTSYKDKCSYNCHKCTSESPPVLLRAPPLLLHKPTEEDCFHMGRRYNSNRVH